MIPTVRAVIFARISFGSIVNVAGSVSQKTTFPPACVIVSEVEIQVDRFREVLEEGFDVRAVRRVLARGDLDAGAKDATFAGVIASFAMNRAESVSRKYRGSQRSAHAIDFALPPPIGALDSSAG